MHKTIMNWDELNLLRSSAEDTLREYRNEKNKDVREGIASRWCDYMEFVLCLIYAYGWHDAEQMIGIVPFRNGLDDKAVNLDIKGETYRERIVQQLDEDSLDGILRIIDTEAHRDYNTGVYDAGVNSGISGLKKQWMTMMDGKVRETHSYLQSMKVGLEDKFYTFDGDSALFPGGFSLPENNVNCRCFVVLSI